jgi:hypothetical protein
MPPLCMNMRLLYEKGWQLESERLPWVVARTWAKMSEDVVLEAMRVRLMQFHAGMVDVKTHGSGPREGDV